MGAVEIQPPVAVGGATFRRLGRVSIALLLSLVKAAWQQLKVVGAIAFLALLVAAVILAAIYLRREDQILVLKLFTVAYFSLLPGFLYLHFSSRKTITVWREYVRNLFELHIDDYAALPEPSEFSRFAKPWQMARDELTEGLAPELVEGIDRRNIYRRKFEDLFGSARKPEHRPHGITALKRQHLGQVGMATVLIAIGWVFVVQPETVFHGALTPSDFHLAGLPTVPRETLAFAFLGSYFYILQMLVRRYFQNDLKATAYVSATMRIVIVTLLVWTIDPLLADTATQPQRSAIAFTIGVFPTVGWQALQLLIKVPLGKLVRTLESRYPLSDVDGLNVWYESRLLEEGIEDMQNLATADLVDVMLNTRIPVERLVDWIDQSLLSLHTSPEEKKGEESDRARLRRYGIRKATDLMDAFACEAPGANGKTFGAELEWLLNGPGEGPSVTRSILATLSGERNLQHIIAWKSFKPDRESDENDLLATIKENSGLDTARRRGVPQSAF